MLNDNLFMIASQRKFRYSTVKGEVTTEDLWSMPLTGEFSLNSVAVNLNQSIKSESEEDFVNESSTDSKKIVDLRMKFDLVREIIAFKKDEKASAAKRAELKAEKEKLLSILAKKEDAQMERASKASIEKRIEELNAQL